MTLCAFSKMPRASLNAVTAPDKKGNVAVCRLRSLIGCRHAAVLVLDGTGESELTGNMFGANFIHVEARVERNAHVTSPIGKH